MLLLKEKIPCWPYSFDAGYRFCLARESGLTPWREWPAHSSLQRLFFLPDQARHNLVEWRGHLEFFSVAPDLAVDRVDLCAPAALQILEHRASMIVG